MGEIRLVARNGAAVCEALERGEILHLDTASEEITDEFLLFAIESGLLEEWASSFPDPRCWCEISFTVLLAASLAARSSVALRSSSDWICVTFCTSSWCFGIQS
jgi:hypothetical protein